MKLITAHRILIAAGILFCGFLVYFSIVEFRRKDEWYLIGMGVASAAIGVLLAWYLKNLGRRFKLDG